jgi:hypothetical protein
MGLERFGDHDGGRAAAPPGPIDSGPDEGALETSDRGEAAVGLVFAELESDQAGAPGGVFALELAGDGQQFLSSSRDRTGAGAIVGRESIETVMAVEPPDVADRAIGDREIGRDLSQGEALLTTPHDLLTERDWEGARHRKRLRSSRNQDQLLTHAIVTYADK